MRQIWKKSLDPEMSRLLKAHKVAIPEMKLYGHLMNSKFENNFDQNKKQEVNSYFIMPRLGQNLEEYFERSKRHIPEASTYSLGIKILALLECVHETGFVFNDLKLDNLMVAFSDKLPSSNMRDSNGSTPESRDIFRDCTINLVDFGFASTYLDKNTNTHLPKMPIQTFRGNLIFASLN